MKALSFASFLILICSAFFTSTSFANEFGNELANKIADNSPTTPSDNNEIRVPASANTVFTAEMRTVIKREVMSQPGVLLDMANMTDNGYAWTNDVVWVGSTASMAATDEQKAVLKQDQWYIAGFIFERPQHKGVWLQYAFTLSELNGKIANFRRWYGNSTFR